MWDFGRAELLEPEAIGEPGQRTFRLRVLSGAEAASLWLEKEQLVALTLAIRQLLEQTAEGESPESEPSPARETFPAQPQVDFKIGRLGIGYDEGRHIVVIFAYEQEEAEEGEDAPPTFACQITRGQCEAFTDQAEEVITAGRPVCILCGEAIEKEGHNCVRRNGHSQRPVSLE